MRTLAQLQAQCQTLGLNVESSDRPFKGHYIQALRRHYWQREYPGQPLPTQIMPMLLSDWTDLDDAKAGKIEQDNNGWTVQPKLDGVRVLLHVESQGVRITSRCVSDVTFRLAEFQYHVPHLCCGLGKLAGTVLDGELICPAAQINTGGTVTAHPLQAAVAILATSPQKAIVIQQAQNARLQLHLFDVLKIWDQDVTIQPLRTRIDLLADALVDVNNAHFKMVPSLNVDKVGFHEQEIDAGREGTVWKQLDHPYETGRRVKHWIKRKRAIELEAFVTGCKPGTPDHGHAHLVGALEFSTRSEADGITPIGWVSGWTDAERQAMTVIDAGGGVALNPAYLDRRAVITGQDLSAKSQRIRHARLVRWL